MVVKNIKYGISYLPSDCMAYRDGYRYGAYKEDLTTSESHITEFFKTTDEIQKFVNEHPEYGRESNG